MTAKRPPKHICIAGAGIAGLTLALALGKLGARVTVLERNDGIQEFGAGLQISPNARHALDSLGLEKAVDKIGFEAQAIDVYPFKASAPVVSFVLGQAITERYNLPYVVMHRANLAQTLFIACKRFANIDIRFGVSEFDIEQHDGHVDISYKCAKQPDQKTQAAAFVGADGVHSITRTKHLSGPAEEYSGYVAWRALLDINDLSSIMSMDNTSLLMGPGFHAVVYPLPHRGAINVALFAKEPRSVAFGSTTTPTMPKSIKQDPRFAQILDLVKEWRQWPLSAVETSVWHKGRVGIIGDAAHAMLPFQAQGAAMAIESAVVLASLLMQYDDSAAAFKSYTKQRYERVTRVAKQSAKNGEIFHMRPPMSLARDLVLKARGPRNHLSRLDWIYGHQPANSDNKTS